MASTTRSKPAPTLPAKKRKASNASSTHSGGSTSEASLRKDETTSTRVLPTRAKRKASSQEESVGSRKSSRDLSVSRLPTKKRKGSNDSSRGGGDTSSTNASRKGSLDSNNSDRVIPEEVRKISKEPSSTEEATRQEPCRKGSADVSSPSRLSASSKVRKGSRDSNDMRPPRKGSQDSLSVTFADTLPRLRKGSNDSGLLDVERKLSDVSHNGLKLPEDTALRLDPPKLEKLPHNALEHLDALGPTAIVGSGSEEKNERKESDADKSDSAATFASSGQRLLLEAIMASSHSIDGSRGRVDAKPAASAAPAPSIAAFSSAPTAAPPAAHITSTHRSEVANRERLESWGAMSDLSIPHNPLDDASGSGQRSAAIPTIPTRISLNRDRVNSVASLSDFNRERLNSMASFSELSLNLPMLLDYEVGSANSATDLQAYVAMAVASVGDQLAELATAVEQAASRDDDSHMKKDKEIGSETSSVASPIIGAVTDSSRGRGGARMKRRPRSWSTSSGKISVDYEAVQAAVDAAQAATGSLDLTAIGKVAPTSGDPSGDATTDSSSLDTKPKAQRRKLPLKRARADSASINSIASDTRKRAALTDEEMESIRERARAVAEQDTSLKRAPPLKKRGKRSNPLPDKNTSQSLLRTPKVSNRTTRVPDDAPIVPLPAKSSSTVSSSKSSKAPANQKWELMFNCLLEFVEERKEEETKDLNDEDTASWVWDGNVPTTYKTKDGKALGRWVNNQRSAKSKGTLKDDREDRLVQAGLKWSVLSSNSWNEMLEELRIYVHEKTQDGKEWDGNVPTSYQIKTRPNSQFQGEDKNLGRWVNRQRSMYQAGRLRKDRQLALEKLGLKWSMLSTTSWDSMYDTLLVYIADRKKEGKDWDGNVPANYKTSDDPPRALGRWINRQRSAFIKKKLKQEYIDKLNNLGLKWSVHERGRGGEDDGDDDSDSDSSENGDDDEK